MSNFNFQNATIGNQTIIENQHGDTNVKSKVSISIEQKIELRDKLSSIQSQLSAEGEIDENFSKALTLVENAMEDAAEENDTDVKGVVGKLKTANSALDQVKNAADKAKEIGSMIEETINWVGGLIG